MVAILTMTPDPDFARLVALGRALRPAWQSLDALAVNGRSVRIVRFEGHFPGYHTHDLDECYVVLDGEILVELEGAPARHLQRGDAYVVRAGTVHQPFALPTAVVLVLT
jgi:mannose-6-phosphate isomerase-like protein (cupin superfamily)